MGGQKKINDKIAQTRHLSRTDTENSVTASDFWSMQNFLLSE